MKIKSFISLIFTPLFAVLRIFIQKSNISLFCSTDMYRYSGNTKYLFEYFSSHSTDDCYWITESLQVKKHLKSEGYKYISNDNILHKLYIILRSRTLYSSGTSYYNPFRLISGDKNLIKICTMHGTGPKLTIERSEDIKKTLRFITDINSYNYISFSTKYAGNIVGVNQLVLPKSKIKILGTPKQDILADKLEVSKRYSKKTMIKDFFGSNYSNQKIIYYSPTFRSYKSELPLKIIENFNEEKFNAFLEKNNLCFLYSYHSLSNFKKGLKDTKNIKFIDISTDHLFDNIQLMMEVDLLIGDYSTLSTDFSILEKPQIFVMPDYSQVKKTKGFAEDFKSILPGKEVKTYDELCQLIVECITNGKIYMSHFSKDISELSEKYIEDRKIKSCDKFLKFHNIINK